MDHLEFTLLLFFTARVFGSLVQLQATDVEYCDKSRNYAVKVTGVEITPDPVVTGKPATFSISASTGQAISGGKLVIEVSYFWLHVHTESHNLCDGRSCPISAGDFVLSNTQTLPGFTPPGSYILKMKMEDENKHQLTCISFSFNMDLDRLCLIIEHSIFS